MTETDTRTDDPNQEPSGVGRLVSLRIGPAIGLCCDPTFALLDAANGAVAEQLWSHIERGAGIDDMLDVLSMTGLRSLGDFAVAQVEPDFVRFVIRGTGRATVTSVGGTRSLDAGGKRTWCEETVERCTGFTLAIGAGDAADGIPLPFRARSAILPIDVLRWPADRAAVLVGVDVPDRARADLPPFAGAAEPVVDATHRPVPPQPDAAPSPSSPPAPPPPVAGTVTDTAERRDDVPSESRPSADVAAAGATLPVGDVLSGSPPPEPEPNRTIDHSAGAGDDYDALYGLTTSTSVGSAAVHTGPPDQEQITDSTVVDVPAAGDHDGMTMSLDQLRAVREVDGDAVGSRAGSAHGSTILARVCHLDHANPPTSTHCRLCHATLSSTPIEVERPTLGRVTLSTGEVIELDRAAVIGRSPVAEIASSAEMPRLVQVAASQSVSRSHAILRLDGWQVLIEDLGTANGTVVTSPGSPPRRVRAGEAVVLEHNAEFDLGGEITGVYDVH